MTWGWDISSSAHLLLWALCSVIAPEAAQDTFCRMSGAESVSAQCGASAWLTVLSLWSSL